MKSRIVRKIDVVCCYYKTNFLVLWLRWILMLLLRVRARGGIWVVSELSVVLLPRSVRRWVHLLRGGIWIVRRAVAVRRVHRRHRRRGLHIDLIHFVE